MDVTTLIPLAPEDDSADPWVGFRLVERKRAGREKGDVGLVADEESGAGDNDDREEIATGAGRAMFIGG